MVEALAEQVQRLSNSLAEKTAATEEQKQRSGKLRHKSMSLMLALSYANLISDVVLAVVLLHGTQSGYGAALLAILGFSLFGQLIVVKFHGKRPWLSKDVFLTAVYLGPALQSLPSVRRRTSQATGCRLCTPTPRRSQGHRGGI